MQTVGWGYLLKLCEVGEEQGRSNKGPHLEPTVSC